MKVVIEIEFDSPAKAGELLHELRGGGIANLHEEWSDMAQGLFNALQAAASAEEVSDAKSFGIVSELPGRRPEHG